MFQIHGLEKLFLETFGDRLHMHIVAITSSFATAINVLFALSVEEVSNRRKDGANLFAIQEPAIDMFQSIFRIFLITVFNIHVANDMIS